MCFIHTKYFITSALFNKVSSLNLTCILFFFFPDSVPLEVSKIGHEAINSFVKHLQNGKQSFYHARGMVVGCAGAGKTSLLERMKRRNISDTEKETRAIHVNEHMFCIQKDKLFGTLFYSWCIPGLGAWVDWFRY